MNRLLLQDLDIQKKKVLMRVDFNVPLTKEKTISDDLRIRAALPSIHHIMEQNGALILMSHLGRPKGEKKSELSLFPCVSHLASLLKSPVQFANDCMGKETKNRIDSLETGQILLLENLRFYEAEENPQKDPSFAKTLASYGDYYVNDAFSACHRKHSSITEITKFFPKKAAAGLLLQKEIDFLQRCTTNPKRPFFAIIGGAKISSKIAVVMKLAEKVDCLYIGGGMAFTFLKAKQIQIGNSLVEEEYIEAASKLLNQYSRIIRLPLDLTIVSEFDNKAPSKIIEIQNGIPEGWQGLDIGPKTIDAWRSEIKTGATIFWNGPMGVFEFPNFAKGTEAIAKILSKCKGISIVGGGDTVAAVRSYNLGNRFSHLSTGGGATLEFIEFGTLPGIEALSPKK